MKEAVVPTDFRCAQCSRLLQAGDASPGTRILCPGCGAFSTVPASDAAPAIEFRCAGCNRLLRTAHDTAGKQARCPACGTVSMVPIPSVGRPDVPASGPAPGGVDEPVPYPSTPPPPGEEFDSPFAPGEAANPYQAPAEYGRPPPRPVIVADPMAAQRVSGPATALIVTGALGIAIQVLNLLAGLLHFGIGMGQGRPNPLPMVFPVQIALAQHSLCLILGIVVIMGALKMKNLESYALAMASAIIAMVPCLSPCCLLGLPFGIWALVVLSDGQVKAAFRS